MLVAGIDIGAEFHHVALVDEAETVWLKPPRLRKMRLAIRNCLSFWRVVYATRWQPSRRLNQGNEV
jgi:hypothetical protein